MSSLAELTTQDADIRAANEALHASEGWITGARHEVDMLLDAWPAQAQASTLLDACAAAIVALVRGAGVRS